MIKNCLIAAALCFFPWPCAQVSAETYLDFTLPDLEGKQVTLSSHTGQGYVVLNFWAKWCVECSEELPLLESMKSLPGADKVVFIGINAGDSRAKVKKFVAKYNYPYKVLLDTNKKVSKKYRIPGLPVTIIISKKGDIVYRGSEPPMEFDFTK